MHQFSEAMLPSFKCRLVEKSDMRYWPVKRRTDIFPGFVLSAIVEQVVLGQIPSGTSHCQVTDPSGAVVTDATVLVTSEAGETLAAHVKKKTAYEIKGLAAGKYAVKAIAQGFALYEQQS